jgi:Domain of unknown function (DUF4331)
MATKERSRIVPAVVASALVFALGAVPLLSMGADHLDAPATMSPSGRNDGDINDVYVFEGNDPSRTVLAMTTHPAAGAISPLEYATDIAYKLKVDRNGDAVADIVYRVRFGAANDDGVQKYRVARRRGDGDLHRIGTGRTGSSTSLAGGGRAFAGLRSDPFFFDLAAFQGAVLGAPNGRTFCDQAGGTEGIDFFESLNTNAIVLEVPDSALGSHIGVWATTSTGDEVRDRIDRMGRPAINTVFNSGEDKNAFNRGRPAKDRARFTGNVKSVLATFSALDDEGAYSNRQLNTLAGVLLPDVITYDTSTSAQGPLNGRALADDVIDAELNIVTGGFPFPGRDGNGAIGSDCVGPHTDYRRTFPYLGEPH